VTLKIKLGAYKAKSDWMQQIAFFKLTPFRLKNRVQFLLYWIQYFY